MKNGLVRCSVRMGADETDVPVPPEAEGSFNIGDRVTVAHIDGLFVGYAGARARMVINMLAMSDEDGMVLSIGFALCDASGRQVKPAVTIPLDSKDAVRLAAAASALMELVGDRG